MGGERGGVPVLKGPAEIKKSSQGRCHAHWIAQSPRVISSFYSSTSPLRHSLLSNTQGRVSILKCFERKQLNSKNYNKRLNYSISTPFIEEALEIKTEPLNSSKKYFFHFENHENAQTDHVQL